MYLLGVWFGCYERKKMEVNMSFVILKTIPLSLVLSSKSKITTVTLTVDMIWLCLYMLLNFFLSGSVQNTGNLM